MTNHSNYNAFFIILFCISIIGCTKDFLDVSPQGTLTDEAAAGDPLIARKLVTGVYNQLYQGGFGQ